MKETQWEKVNQLAIDRLYAWGKMKVTAKREGKIGNENGNKEKKGNEIKGENNRSEKDVSAVAEIIMVNKWVNSRARSNLNSVSLPNSSRNMSRSLQSSSKTREAKIISLITFSKEDILILNICFCWIISHIFIFIPHDIRWHHQCWSIVQESLAVYLWIHGNWYWLAKI